METRRIGLGLGLFSVALGAVEVIAARRIARGLSAGAHPGVVAAFGARELAAGAGLLMHPAHRAMVWNRVAGDAMDIGALALAARRAPRNPAIWGALGFVAAATLVDVLAARRPRDTGTAPAGPGEARIPEPALAIGADAAARADASSGTGGATTIEPAHMPAAQAPAVA